MVSFLNDNTKSRGIRNNNPGNLIYTPITWNGKIPYAQNRDWSGTPSNVVKQFEQFTDLASGIRAMASDLFNDVKHHGYSLAQLIYEYAPPTENNTTLYINQVKNATGINADAPLVFTHLLLSEVIRAMIMMENGSTNGALVTDQDIVNGINMLPGSILDTLGAFVQENKKSIATGLVVTGLAVVAAYGGYRYLNRAV